MKLSLTDGRAVQAIFEIEKQTNDFLITYVVKSTIGQQLDTTSHEFASLYQAETYMYKTALDVALTFTQLFIVCDTHKL